MKYQFKKLDPEDRLKIKPNNSVGFGGPKWGGKTLMSITEMLNQIDPELAELFVKHITNDLTLNDSIMIQITSKDKEILSMLPEGWFTLDDLPHSISRKEYRMSRLEDLGRLKSEPLEKLPIGANEQKIKEWLRKGKKYCKIGL